MLPSKLNPFSCFLFFIATYIDGNVPTTRSPMAIFDNKVKLKSNHQDWLCGEKRLAFAPVLQNQLSRETLFLHLTTADLVMKKRF